MAVLLAAGLSVAAVAAIEPEPQHQSHYQHQQRDGGNADGGAGEELAHGVARQQEAAGPVLVHAHHAAHVARQLAGGLLAVVQHVNLKTWVAIGKRIGWVENLRELSCCRVAVIITCHYASST